MGRIQEDDVSSTPDFVLRPGVFICIYVVAQFYPWCNSYFPFFVYGIVYCMIMNTKQRKIKIEPRIKLKHDIYIIIM